MQGFHLFGSRVATHIAFWLIYFLTFGFIWGEPGAYWQSYYLEFILLPTRMFAVYMTLYVLIPKFLKPKKLLQLVGIYLLLIAVSAILQRAFSFYFYERTLGSVQPFWMLGGLLRNVILINSTVIFVAALKITQLWWLEGDRNKVLKSQLRTNQNEIIEIKSDRRVYRIPANDILFVEGLGNYVIYHTTDKKLTSYGSLKQALDHLPVQFTRIHKSYLINREKVISYDQDNVEIAGQEIPLGRSYKTSLSLG